MVIVLILLFVASFLQAELNATPFVRAGLIELETLHDMGQPAASIYASITEGYISSQPDLIYLQVSHFTIHFGSLKFLNCCIIGSWECAA